jgi:hypothetical protein
MSASNSKNQVKYTERGPNPETLISRRPYGSLGEHIDPHVQAFEDLIGAVLLSDDPNIAVYSNRPADQHALARDIVLEGIHSVALSEYTEHLSRQTGKTGDRYRDTHYVVFSETIADHARRVGSTVLLTERPQ